MDALPGAILATLESIDTRIANLRCAAKYKDFFRLALLAIIPRYSRAVATGGWLKWVDTRSRRTSIAGAFRDQVDMMIRDVGETSGAREQHWAAKVADARQLPAVDGRFSAVITSPPYPNRHDYTRVFGVELMFAFLDWEATRAVRYQSIQSHPEARPDRPSTEGYDEPARLTRAVRAMAKAGLDRKICEMLHGYFTDMHLCLRESQRVVEAGGKIAFVVGNARYAGRVLKVDELLAEIGDALGLTVEQIIAVRFRGNSAQQMGRYGRKPSRESVVVFRNSRTTAPPSGRVPAVAAQTAGR